MHARDLIHHAGRGVALIFCATVLVSCGPPGGPAGSGGSGATSVSVTASPATVPVSTASTITATVSASGAPVADGTAVTFTLSSSAYGTLSAASATTTGGIATVTFTGSTTVGTVTITATSGTAKGTVSVGVGTAPPPTAAAGGVVFVSATPNVIGIQGGGQVTNSAITFAVTDASGNPVAGTAVSFTMKGPSGGRQPSAGGEYIGTDDGTPTTASGVTDASGDTTVLLNSGQVAGPVTVTATVTVGTSVYQASSSVVSIGGGVPSGRHFSLAASLINLPGFTLDGAQSTITAYVADRFGNYNVLAGTSVSFYTEAGAIDRSVTLDSTGQGSVMFRTQLPWPEIVTPTAADTTTMGTYDSTYNTTGYSGVSPRDGWVTVLAVVQGEESFVDANGNGLYDTGETFTDQGEPYIDANDNGVWDPGEFYIDENGNGAYDPPNGVWDGPNCPDTKCRQSKLIWQTIKLMFTGDLVCAITPGPLVGFNVPNGGSQHFQFSVSDKWYLNSPVSGTSITLTASAGKLVMAPIPTVLDGISDGPTYYDAWLDDPDPTTTTPTDSVVTLTATPPGGTVAGCTTYVKGTVN